MNSDLPLVVEGLTVRFGHGPGQVTAVDQVSFEVAAGRTLGIVGESGSGKSVTSLAVMRLLSERASSSSGSVRVMGQEMLSLGRSAVRSLRGNVISMIFQEPMTSLNPAYRIGDQIAEAVRQHSDLTGAAAKARAVEMLRRVGIPSPESRYNDYPHRLSGGMRQRVMIAMALACDPKVLIADEPTTALDVTIQAQILQLLRQLRDETGTAIVLISHDLGVIAEICDDVVVMYAGQVVERGPVAEIFANPQHPYTVGLLGSLPSAGTPGQPLPVIPGTVPQLSDMPKGCRFRARCPFRQERCHEPQPLLETAPARLSRCWRAPLTEIAL